MPVVAQKIEIKASNKFKTYCRKGFGVSRFVYNWCVERFTKDYQQYLTEWSVYNRKLKEYSSSPLLHTQMPVKPKLPSAIGYKYKNDFNSKKKELYPFTKEVTKYASQQPFINFDRAVNAFIKAGVKGKRKKGLKDCFPKYKKKSYSSGSFYIGGDQVKVKTSVSCSRRLENKSQKQYLKIPLFGYVQLKEKLRFEGHINSVTISQRGDRFFASFSIKISQEEFDRTHKAAVQNKTAVGIDLGLKSALVLSDGMAIKAPKPLKKSLLRLKRLQRQLNRKNHPRTKGDKTKVSKNYIKQSKRLNKLHLRIHNIREDFIHKVTTALVRNYEYICLEDLNVKGMMRNHHLARAISDIGFYRFKSVLMYKALNFNRTVVVADRFYPSSKTCSRCGAIKENLTLKDRVYECKNCGAVIDRDLNAAVNLKNQIKEKIGRATPELTPVELTALQDCFNQNNLATSSVETGIRLKDYNY